MLISAFCPDSQKLNGPVHDVNQKRQQSQSQYDDNHVKTEPPLNVILSISQYIRTSSRKVSFLTKKAVQNIGRIEKGCFCIIVNEG